MGFAKSGLWSVEYQLSCLSLTSVAFSDQSVLSLGNDGTGLAGFFAVQGLQVLAHRCPEFRREPRLRRAGPPALLAPSLDRRFLTTHCQVGCRREMHVGF